MVPIFASASLARRPEEQEQAADQAADMTGANMGEVEAAATRNGGGAVTAASAVASCPPDGGARAWMVLAASFLCNGLLFGIINTYGVIYVYLLMDLEKAKVPDAASKALGASLTYTPSLVVLGHYFKRYLGVANGLVAAGSSVFSVLLPYPLEWLLKRFGFSGSLLLLSAMLSLIIGCSFLFKPLAAPAAAPARSARAELFNVDIWRRRKYVIWALAIPTALFGYFVPYVHMV
ncbi:hypothetical protein FOCC_FOCC001739, partial [Frankliniella occidentalis]